MHRELNSGGTVTQIDKTITYHYKNYDVEKVAHRKSYYIITNEELTSKNLYDDDFKNKTKIYGREYSFIPIVDTVEERFRIICSPFGSRGSLRVYILNGTTSNYKKLIMGR